MMISLAEHLKPVRALARPHKGIVVGNDDPDQLGRVKVEIKGLLEGSAEDLPWTMTLFSPNSLDIPDIGDELYIVFPYQTVYFPFCLGHWISSKNKNEDFGAGYPKTFGKSKFGFKMLFNPEDDEALFEHPSGTLILVDENGVMNIETADGLNFTVEGDVAYTAQGFEFTSEGAFNITASGDIVISSDGAFNVSASGDASIEADGMVVISGTGGTEVGASASQTMVNGSVVLLGGGGLPVAVLTSTAIGTGNLGGPVVSTIVDGSSVVQAAL